MSDKTILAIDQGTTSSRAILFSLQGDILDVQQKELQIYTPNKGWVEQDANQIWEDTLWASRNILERAGQSAKDVAGIGITNQRETTIVWDRKTGEPVYNAIVWQDRRTAQLCRDLKKAGHEDAITQKTGLLLDPYFSATKIAWILDNVDGVRSRAENGDLAFGTVDCYLLWKLTNGAKHCTDITNASRTMLFNIQTCDWDDDLLKLFNIPRSLLPQVQPNAYNYGETDTDILGRSYSIAGMAGDQQSAMIGQGCFEHGMVKATYGTGCFALMNIGPQFKQSENRLLTTIGYQIGSNTAYALEGSIFIAGAVMQWLRDNMRFFEDASESEAMANSVPDSNGVYFVPAFAGLGAPYWMPDAQGLITGITRETDKAHITRAALEAQAYQTHDLMAAMKADSGIEIAQIRADGGLVNNGFMCQFMADILDLEVQRPKVIETTAYGAACLAALQLGLYKDLNDVSESWTHQKSYHASMDPDKRKALIQGWKSAVHMIINS